MSGNREAIGGNNPPTDIEILQQQVRDRHGKAFDRAKALLDAADRMPSEVADDDGQRKLVDFADQIKACVTVLEAGRVIEKRPLDERVAAVQVACPKLEVAG